MKKLCLIISILLFSFIAYSQKGISYQAVILDPNKIEIPGQDITGQPYVNSEVWVKFNISLGTTVQFEEVQKTKTDSYGLVNLVIGSEANTLFNSLIWDANQKSLQVYVSLNKGSTFTKVSDQKLLYVPYALNAESASKFTGIVPVSSGGTGATNAPDARINLGLVIGKDVQAPLTAGVDYLTPSGNAASATTANNITATTNTSLTSLSNLSIVGTITKGVWNGSTIAIANGGTGATTAIEALNNLGAAAIESPSFRGTPTAPNPATGDNSTQIATTAFVTGAIQGANQGLASSYVPYTGATKSVDLGAFDLTVNGVNAGMGKGNISTNTVFGNGALSNNTTGANNTAYGALTLGTNTAGIDNTAIGALSLYPNTTGSQNTATGSRSLRNNTTGTDNTANGALSLTLNTVGSENTATGSRSLRNNITGINNTANGYAALRENTSGGGNTANGFLALLSNTIGSNNTAIGSEADVTTNNLSNATAVGYQAKVSGSNTIQLGNTSVTSVKTSGAMTTGLVTYPTAHGTNGQVLTTTGSGTLTWTTLSNSQVGIIPIVSGGTGASNAAAARSNLGLQIGVNVQAPLISGIDYLTPTGNAASLTNFPTLNQNTTGNASTATTAGTASTANKLVTARNINGVAFDGSTDITIAASASTLSGIVQVANGGTGTSSITGLVKGNGTNPMTAAVAGVDYLTPTGSAASLTNFPTLNQNTTGNASTATTAGTASTANKLVTARNINGVAFDGSTDITIAASASTLSGITLASNVISSSLTSVGTLSNLTVTNPIAGSITGNAATASLASNITATNNSSLTTISNLSSIGTVTTGTISLTTDIKTTGKIISGAVAYPNTDGLSGQILTTNGNGSLEWQSGNSLISNSNYYDWNIPDGYNNVSSFINNVIYPYNQLGNTNDLISSYGIGYTVPAGKNLYLYNVKCSGFWGDTNNGVTVDGIRLDQYESLQTYNDNGNIIGGSNKWLQNIKYPMILGPGSLISMQTGSSQGNGNNGYNFLAISGFLVDKSVDVIFTSSTYTVPVNYYFVCLKPQFQAGDKQNNSSNAYHFGNPFPVIYDSNSIVPAKTNGYIKRK